MKAKNAALTAIFLLAVLLCCLSASLAGQIGELGESVSVRWKAGSGVSPAALLRQEKRALEDGAQDAPQATLWQEELKSVAGPGGEGAYAKIVSVFGDCERVTRRRLLSGSFPARSDSLSCAISDSLAFELWGSPDALGMPLYIDGRLYHVIGVFSDGENKLFLQPAGDSSLPLSSMQLVFPEGGSREEAEGYLLLAGFAGGRVLDTPLISWGAGMLTWLPAAALAIGMLLRIIGRGRRLFAYRLLFLEYAPIALLFVAGAVLIMDFPGIPARIIPTRWSDMEFWTRLFSGFSQNLRAWLLAVPSARDMELWPRVIALMPVSAVAAFLAISAARRVKIRSLEGLVIGCAASMTAVFIISLFFKGLELSRWVYLLPCLWLALDFALYLHGERITRKAPKGPEQKPPEEAREDVKASQAKAAACIVVPDYSSVSKEKGL